MREMKDSRVLWIGEIPADWEIGRVSFFFEAQLGKMLQPRKATDLDTFEYYLCAANLGKNELKLEPLKQMWFSPSEKCAYEVKKGDLMVVEGGDVASCAIIDTDIDTLYFQNSLHRVRPLSGFDVRILKYLLMITKDAGHIDLICNKATIAHFSKEKLLGLPCVVMPIVAQHKIADYLDRNCSKIDAIIARQQQVIEKLKAYKLSVITEAVTKGLNPDVPMKDSGIEWIGMIPAHWDILKLQAHTRMLTPMRDRPEKLDGDIPWVRIEDYDGKYISASKEGLGVSPETVQEMNLKIYPIGSILCTSSCDLGKCAIVTRELVSNQRFINIIPDSDTNSDYLYYLMLSNAERLNHLSTGTIQANLSRKAFEHLMVQFPPNSEQAEIAEYLDRKCAKIESSISKRQELIDSLSAYKKSLIYEVVTGKREIAADLSAVTSVVVLAPALIAELREKRAALMVRFIDGLGDKNKGRTQIQKCMSLAEGLIDLQLGIQLVRQHYGPYDEDIQTYEQIMAEHEWVNHAKKKGRIQYTHGKRFQEYYSVYQRFFGDYDCEIQRIIDFVKPIKHTSEIGRMATLFAAWNDFILDGIPNPTDAQIISEVRSNWTDNKANTPVETWQDSLGKLRAAGMVPHGYGRHTVKLEEGDRTRG